MYDYPKRTEAIPQAD